MIGNETFLGIPTGLVAALGSVIVPFSKKGTYARQLPRNVRQIDKRVRYRMDKAEAWTRGVCLVAGVLLLLAFGLALLSEVGRVGVLPLLLAIPCLIRALGKPGQDLEAAEKFGQWGRFPWRLRR